MLKRTADENVRIQETIQEMQTEYMLQFEKINIPYTVIFDIHHLLLSFAKNYMNC